MDEGEGAKLDRHRQMGNGRMGCGQRSLAQEARGDALQEADVAAMGRPQSARHWAGYQASESPARSTTVPCDGPSLLYRKETCNSTESRDLPAVPGLVSNQSLSDSGPFPLP